MTAQDIGYIELYTSDKNAVINYLVSMLGFTEVGESGDHQRHSSLLRQGRVDFIVTSGPATEDFLEIHGDGIADISFTCDNVMATCNAAMAAGGTILDSRADKPAVTGFGGVRHTLLPERAAGDTRPADDQRSQSGNDAPGRPGGHIRQIDHVAVCLDADTMTDYCEYYESAFGLNWYSSEYVDVGDSAMDSVVVRSRSTGITFTMLEPDHSKSPGQLDSFLSRNNGPGVQHIAFLVDSIIPAVKEYRMQGAEFLGTPEQYYEALKSRCPDLVERMAELRSAGVLVDRDEWGYLLQLFTRSPYERNTLFYELIQRRGALGFGSANIRALYEAVERDRQIAL